MLSVSGAEVAWYLLRTKAGQERRVEAQVRRIADEVLLPLTKSRVRRLDRLVESVTPLFPCYLFAWFDFQREWRNLRSVRGLQGMVRFGGEPAVVPECMIGELKQRCAQGPVELVHRAFLPGESVKVVDGPLWDLEGIFERRLSGSERVAILLSLMGGTRVLLPASMVVSVT